MAGVCTLSALPANTVRLIGSTQVITSVFSVIKELIENSFDAESTHVDIKLENFGLDRIEIRDNGKGISATDIPFVAKRHYTSKIASHADLEQLTSYGFRGEALASLCSVADVSITTKTQSDEVSMTYAVTSSGEILNGKPSHLGNGTLIVASNLFKNLPVRKHYYNTSKKKKEELKKIEDLLISFGVICPTVRLTFRHNKEMVWQKNSMTDMKAAMFSLLGRSVMTQLEFKHVHEVEPNVDITMFLPKPSSDILVTSRTSSDRSFLFVNSRPVTIKQIEKLIRTYYCNSYGCDNNRYPVFVVSVTVPPNEIDVNVDPNKTKVMIHKLNEVRSCVEKVLLYMYGPLDTARSWRNGNKDVENHMQDDNPEARALVSQYSRQLSEDKHATTHSEPSTSESTHYNKSGSKPCDKSDISTHPNGRIFNLDLQPDTVDLSVPIETNNSCSKPNDKPDISTCPNSEIFNLDFQPDTVDLSAAKWDIDLADYEQSQPVVDSAKSSLNSGSLVGPSSEHEGIELESSSDSQIHSDGGQVGKDEVQGSEKPSLKGGKDEVQGDEKPSLKGDKEQLVSDMFSVSDDITDSMLDDLLGTFPENHLCNKDNPDLSDRNEHSSELPNNTNKPNTHTDKHSSDVGDNLSKIMLTEIGDDHLTLLKSKDITPSAAVGRTLAGSGADMERDAETWSRGHSVSVNGRLAQPVSLLSPTSSHMPGKRPASPLASDILPPEKRRSASHQTKSLLQGQTTLYDIIDDHPVQRESGFNVFVKDFQAAVIKENPHADVEEINHMFRDKWKKLSENERLKYMSLVNRSAVKDTSKNTKTPSKLKDMSGKVKKKLDKGRSVRDQLLSQMKKSTTKKKQVQKPTRDVTFSLSKLQHSYLSGFRQTQSQSECKKILVGCIRTCGAWVCSQGTELLLVNPHRIAETILYHRLLEQHKLSADILDKPVPLSASVVGGDSHWQMLTTMAEQSWSHDPRVYIQDERIVGNGLKILCQKANESGEVVAELVGVSKHIPMYGVNDLCEILDLITNTAATTLSQSRPLKVINYLKSEAVRMSRQTPAQRNKEDMLDMFTQIEDVLPTACSHCLHNKPFFHKLCDLHQLPGDDTLLATPISQE